MVTVITGSASGMGAAIRTRLEEAGDKVIGIDLKNAEVIADLSTREGCATAIAAVKQNCGNCLDCFVAAAGLGPEVKDPWLIAAVNYFGVVNMLDGLFELLQRGSSPAAVVFSSNAAQLFPMEEDPFVLALLNDNEADAKRIISKLDDSVIAYAGSKNAVARAVRHRTAGWGNSGVRLNAIAPGLTKTPMLQRGLDDPFLSGAMSSVPLPLGRYGEPEEIAALVVFLLSPEASYIHGAVYCIDGGQDAQTRPDRF